MSGKREASEVLPADPAGIAAADIAIIIHGTTLATNSIIERKGARTALITTEGFRDVIAMGNESRYDQYDLNITLPEPLVPRHLRLPVAERAAFFSILTLLAPNNDPHKEGVKEAPKGQAD